MKNPLSLDLTYALSFLPPKALQDLKPDMQKAYQTLMQKSGRGNDFLGWLHLPSHMDQAEYARIKQSAKRVKDQSDVLVVIGIGGSYLGAKAALEMLRPYFKQDDSLEILFAGHHISGTYLNELVAYLKNKDFSINVISKSGTTTEPAIAFRVLKNVLEEKYGKHEAKSRIYATTDQARGALKTLAVSEGYESFIVPDDVGGRYSVLTAVGLLPLACAGIDIDAMIEGAQAAQTRYQNDDVLQNDACLYAATRTLLYRAGKKVEMMVNYEPALGFVSEWWKQLYGESEGKENKGLFVASAAFSTDLHSLGQYIQEGERHLFETVLWVDNQSKDVTLTKEPQDLDGLNYLEGKTMDFVNQKAFEGTLLAHVDGGVPNIIIRLPRLDAYTFGQLVYFFEFACGISAYMLDVNPFDQPGVEAYKKNMFALLGKPGFEDLRKALETKLQK